MVLALILNSLYFQNAKTKALLEKLDKKNRILNETENILMETKVQLQEKCIKIVQQV